MSTLTLSAVLDLTAASALKDSLVAAFADGDAVLIDAAQVQQIGSPCLQILAAAVQHGAAISASSQVLSDTAVALNLLDALKLEGSHV